MYPGLLKQKNPGSVVGPGFLSAINLGFIFWSWPSRGMGFRSADHKTFPRWLHDLEAGIVGYLFRELVADGLAARGLVRLDAVSQIARLAMTAGIEEIQ